MKSTDIVGFILVAVPSVIITLVSLFRVRQKFRLQRTGKTAAGIVIWIEHEAGKSPAFYPVVRFQNAQQELVTVRSSFGITADRYKEGDQVTVRFDPADSNSMSIDGEGLSFGDWMTVAFGISGLVYAVWKYFP
ncbi:hypothetical protein HNQ93_003783 [Hymenobacter luteus]|uniref:DUF3592 domain-containing protein n=2 Tax=Hymenobacter TaxID=89966 RepID=A0A7W9WEP4_9BACT|nr:MULTISPECIES: DUF3592 domain-containing protein [Hymenobacter]MBB4603134.1 hypothetical protein [Hymenobacter latericoloratus]MBB6060907.1 hypothetical protein [Hymenobacter luteus]